MLIDVILLNDFSTSLVFTYLYSIGTWKNIVNMYAPLDQETWKLAERGFPVLQWRLWPLGFLE